MDSYLNTEIDGAFQRAINRLFGYKGRTAIVKQFDSIKLEEYIDKPITEEYTLFIDTLLDCNYRKELKSYRDKQLVVDYFLFHSYGERISLKDSLNDIVDSVIINTSHDTIHIYLVDN